jgi:hypothetical protein
VRAAAARLAAALVISTLAAVAPAAAQGRGPDGWAWAPSLYVLGTSERGHGEAYAPPNDNLRRDDAGSLGLGLDLRAPLGGGRLEGSAFGLAHDPLSGRDRGFYGAARIRATSGANGAGWRFRAEAAPRLQRRSTATLSDFQRNDLWVEVEQAALEGTRFGLRLGDRRRSVRHLPAQDFARQSLAASLTGGDAAGHQWRLESGPQRYSTDAGSGWRMATAFEAAAALGRGRIAVRVQWLEELSNRGGAGAAAPTANPPPPRPAASTLPGPPTTVELHAPADMAMSGAPSPSPAPASGKSPDGLLGASMFVDPLEGDEGDWDFGRRKVELVALATRALTPSLRLTAELRAYLERGNDFTYSSVRRDRVALRLYARWALGPRAALLLQGGFESLSDNRPGLAYSRGLASLGLELRP